MKTIKHAIKWSLYKDNKVKERMLRESSKLTLAKAQEICQAAESTRDQMKSMNNKAQRT